MKFWVGVTDPRWYDFLAAHDVEEVNFWQPSPRPPFSGAPVGMPFLFKLKGQVNKVAGGGFFVTHSELPLSLAWEVFGIKNGAPTLQDLESLIKPLSGSNGRNRTIGCTVLANPIFLPPRRWVKPPDWAPNIVRGKMYDTDRQAGSALWAAISADDIGNAPMPSPVSGVVDVDRKFGEPILVKPRLGQSSFRLMITEAYKRRCAITGEHTLIALEAAHIVPYATEGTHDPRNGLLLRADFHRLYDAGLVGITPDLKVHISPRIREAYFNGKAYYRLDGVTLAQIPDSPALQPDPDRLNWHYKNCFQQ